jgi:hypothetical protein
MLDSQPGLKHFDSWRESVESKVTAGTGQYTRTPFQCPYPFLKCFTIKEQVGGGIVSVASVE